MSISKAVLAIPLSLGIACSTTSQQSYTGGAGAERIASDGSMPGDPPPRGAEATVPTSAGAALTAPGGSEDGLVVQPAAGSTWAASDPAGASGSSGSGSGGAMGTGAGGAMGSGGSSETMGSGSASGSSDQGTAGSGSSDHAQQGAASGSGDTVAHSDDQQVRGKIAKVSKDEISIAPRGGEAKTLKISPQTTVTINGKDAKPTQLKQGQMVRASFASQDGDEIAVKIEVGKAGKAQGRMKGHHGDMPGHPGSSGASGSDSGASGGSR